MKKGETDTKTFRYARVIDASGPLDLAFRSGIVTRVRATDPSSENIMTNITYKTQYMTIWHDTTKDIFKHVYFDTLCLYSK